MSEPTQTLPTPAEVVAYAETWGTSTDEVAEWLHDHEFYDGDTGGSGGITRNCVVAMALRHQFPALNDSHYWLVASGGAFIIIHTVDPDDCAELPEPVRNLIEIVDNHRGDNGDDSGPYPFLYAAAPSNG